MTTLLFNSCFTGVETTRKITGEDALKIGAETKHTLDTRYDSIVPEQFVDWKIGKQFYITDNNIRLVLYSPKMNLDTLDLKNKTVEYGGYVEENRLGIEKRVYIILKDLNGNDLYYKTGKTVNELKDKNYRLKIPFTIDYDMVNAVKEDLAGKTLYIKSPIWFNEFGEQKNGYKFEKIKILDVLPGNKVYSLNIKFDYNGKTSYIYLSTKDNSVSSRLFSSLFSFNDPHLDYPLISDEIWELIKKGEIKEYMTKDECNLSIGLPSDVKKMPTYNGLEEYWFYGNGVYLFFRDGVLTEFRK